MSNDTIPKTIRRSRTKKFTKIRRPYKTYLRADWNWQKVFLELDKLKSTNSTFLKDTAKKYGIQYSTLSKKYNKYCKSSQLAISYDTENRGGSNKVFSCRDERNIYNRIINEYINKDKLLNDTIIKEIALAIAKNDESKKNYFEASNGWCYMFKKRWNLSTQTVKPLRIATNHSNEDEQSLFLLEYQTAISGIKKKYF